MDNQIIRDLFTQCIEAAKILGIEDELNQEIIAYRELLVPTQIGKHGQIMEWPEDYEEEEPGHRHISHLYGLHPSTQITMDKTKELADAARKTLERRLSFGGGHTGWSRAWIINMYARLWDGDTAYYNLTQLLGKSTLPNMFDNHPPFQIDGNFGGCAGIAEMLVQSTLDRTILLPALPTKFNTGHIYGVCIKGGGELSMEWKDGKLTSAIVLAHKDMDTILCYNNKDISISLRKGEKKEYIEQFYNLSK